MEMERYEPGVPSWVDLGTGEIDAAARFYGGLFGWSSEEGPPEAGGYRVCTLRDRPVAGLGPQMNPGPPAWTSYVTVGDADRVAGVAAEAGGRVIVSPMDVLDAGRMAVLADPAGAAISVWQPNSHQGAGIVNEPGTLTWNELMTDDVDGSKEFYGKLFAWDATTHAGGPVEYTEFTLDGRSVAGMLPRPETMPAEVPPHWGVYFAVTDTDTAASRAGELGGTTVMDPFDVEPGRVAVLCDPTGATFNVITLKNPL